jgi:thioredoxin 1
MSNVVHVTDADFAEVVLKSEVPVLVDFWAPWCGPCKMIAPILDEISTERKDIKIVKMDVDQNQATAKKYGVRSIPSLYIFNQGKVDASKLGASSKAALVGWIDVNI